MPLTASEKGGVDYDPIDEGLHEAICYGIWDLGTQITPYGKKHQVLITWELPRERLEIEDETGSHDLPRTVSKFYTLSLDGRANLRKHLETWRSKGFIPEELEGFDIQKLLSVPCTLQIIHKENKQGEIRANIIGISPKMQDIPKKNPENKLVYFSYEDHTNIPANTPEWVSDIIQKAEEWGKGTADPEPKNEGLPVEEDSDPIPF